ncbi:MAG: trypsin-like peptidase domain-containing protein [Verrucomicrobiota bacterium]
MDFPGTGKEGNFTSAAGRGNFDVFTPMEFYVLENGEILGPFTREFLAAQVESGVFTARHMAQQKGRAHWTPIFRVLQTGGESFLTEEALAPDWQTILQWGYQRLRFAFEQQPAMVGGVALLGGSLFFFLSFLPALFWLPWFAGALLASILLIRLGKVRLGAAMMAGAVLIPALLAFAFSTHGKTGAMEDPAKVEENEPLSIRRPLVAGDPSPEVSQSPPQELPPAFLPEPEPETTPEGASDQEVARNEPPPRPPATLPVSRALPVVTPPGPVESAVQREPVGESRTGGRVAVLPPLPPPVLLPASQTPSAIPLSLAPPTSDLPSLSNEDQTSRLVREHSNSLVFVDDAGGSTGSGFVAQLQGKTFLFTNIHVVAGMKGPRLTRLDRSPISPGAGSAAVGHDVMRYEAPPGARPLQIMEGVENNALIGDDVVVLGNSEGAHVILPLEGKISGIGPNLVEVTAEFVPGNSGSPIIHKKSGQVIGIATYLVKRDLEWFSEKTADSEKAKKIRRFGYRIDSISQWQPVFWVRFVNENSEVEQIHTLTRDLALLLDDIRDDGRLMPGRHQNKALSRSVQTYLERLGRQTRDRISPQDRLQNAQRFLSDMRSASQNDLRAAKQRISYDYFQRALGEEEQIRSRFREVFDRLVKAQM